MERAVRETGCCRARDGLQVSFEGKIIRSGCCRARDGLLALGALQLMLLAVNLALAMGLANREAVTLLLP